MIDLAVSVKIVRLEGGVTRWRGALRDAKQNVVWTCDCKEPHFGREHTKDNAVSCANREWRRRAREAK